MSSEARFELYEDDAGDWRWRLVHRNGNIIADSGQGYASKQKAQEGLKSVKQNAAGAPIGEPVTDRREAGVTGYNKPGSSTWHRERECSGTTFDPTDEMGSGMARDRGLEPCDNCCGGEWPDA